MAEAARLPERGRPWAEIEAELDRYKSLDVASSATNRLMTGLHIGEDAIHEVCQRAYLKYFHANAVFAELEQGIGRMQREVLAWTVDLLNGGPDGRANFTSGGSESIFCAVHAAREWAKVNRPTAKPPYRIVMPRTGHAAFDKAAHYQGLEIVRVPTTEEFTADVDRLEAAVTPNTIMIVGSSPCWGFGRVDPIPDIAALAERHGLWLHVDACVGGFLLPFFERLGEDVPVFDFRLPAVCSISADLHKHGYAAKPASTVSYRSEEHQGYHYVGVAIDDWQSGMYKTHGVVGSRPASSIAAAWAVMSVLGEDGYTDLTRRALIAKTRLVDGIEAIEDFQVLRNQALLVPFRSETLNMLNVLGGLVERGYFPWGTFEPIYIHPSAEPVDDGVIDSFLKHLSEVGTGVRDGTITAQALATYIGS